MDIRYSVSPQTTAELGTGELRRQFLVERVFVDDTVTWTYAQDDRMMLGGCTPRGTTVALDSVPALTGTEHVLARRELGVFNIGGPARIAVGSADYDLERLHGLYIGRTEDKIAFSSVEPGNPARLYLVSTPAHRDHPVTIIKPEEAETVELGSSDSCNERTLRKYIHPNGAPSCQLVMGFTTIHTGSVWNTMPCHTHMRRMESYLYFDLAEDAVVFHFMGRPNETRHLVVRNEQAVISPPWSIHSGAGTSGYSFVWAMAGENQAFTDMDAVPMPELA